MVGLHAHRHMLAEQRVGHGEKIVRRLKMNLRPRSAVCGEQIFERLAVTMADEHCRNGREIRAAQGNKLIAARRADAAGVGGEIINHRENSPGLSSKVDFVGGKIRAALN